MCFTVLFLATFFPLTLTSRKSRGRFEKVRGVHTREGYWLRVSNGAIRWAVFTFADGLVL